MARQALAGLREAIRQVFVQSLVAVRYKNGRPLPPRREFVGVNNDVDFEATRELFDLGGLDSRSQGLFEYVLAGGTRHPERASRHFAANPTARRAQQSPLCVNMACRANNAVEGEEHLKVKMH